MGVDVAIVLRVVGDLAYVALGLGVLAAAPRELANRGFALFAIATVAPSLVTRATRAVGVEWDESGLNAVFFAGSVLGAGGLLLLASAFPTPLRRRDSRLAFLALGIGAAVALAWAAWWQGYYVAAGGPSWTWGLMGHAEALEAGVAWSFLALLALRARSEEGSIAPHAVVSVAILASWTERLGGLLWPAPEVYAGELFRRGAVVALGLGSLAVLWTLVLVRARTPRWAIAPLWVTFASALVGLVAFGLRSRDEAATQNFVRGLADVIAGALVAIAIARGQVPGLAARVRWTLSRSTIAAAFVAAFFVASEGAQQVLGDSTGSAYVGILAAGALVFAMAPLQRAAERLAERAVPIATPAAAAATPTRGVQAPDAERAYRNAVGLALRDRRLSRDDEVRLAEVAESLGLGAGRALAILAEEERKRGAARDERDGREVSESIVLATSRDPPSGGA